jgi:hypothetical protein
MEKEARLKAAETQLKSPPNPMLEKLITRGFVLADSVPYAYSFIVISCVSVFAWKADPGVVFAKAKVVWIASIAGIIYSYILRTATNRRQYEVQRRWFGEDSDQQ